MAPKAREWRRQDQQVGGRVLERLEDNLLKTIDDNQRNNNISIDTKQQHFKSSKQVGNELNYHHKGARNLQSFKQDHQLWSLTAKRLSVDRAAKLSQERTSRSGINLSNSGDTGSPNGDSDRHHLHQQHHHHHLQRAPRQRQRRHLEQANLLQLKGELGSRPPFQTKQQAPVSSNPSRPAERAHLAEPSSLALLLLPLLALSFVFTSASTAQSVSRAAVPAPWLSSISAAQAVLTPVSDHSVGAAKVYADKADGQLSADAPARSAPVDHQLPLQRRSSPLNPAFGSPLDHISSANLPAEFRGDPDDESAGGAPREQSKLARLCQQTSSVLASVLPAPFGGHKRSILCQFFGQVPVRTNNQVQQQPHQKHPSFVAPPAQRPMEAESIAVLHQPQQPPITLHSSGRHPIQIVLEEQQRQYLAGLAAPQTLQAQPPQQFQQAPAMDDLKSSASILDYSFQQKVQAPELMKEARRASARPKYSTPAASTSFKPVSPKLQSDSRAGWRIFNQPPDTTQSPAVTTPTLTRSTLTSTSAPSSTTSKTVVRPQASRNESAVSAPTGIHQSEAKKSGAESSPLFHLLVMGKPPIFNQQQSKLEGPKQLTIGKRSEALKSTTKAAIDETSSTGKDSSAADVRIIEVVAQASASNSSASNSDQQTARVAPASSTTTSTQKPAADLHQVQKREELVIASINNLTRIAFGNQLRDTVKVINKLIDQQSSLFNKPADPFLTSESRKSVVKSLESSKSDKLPSDGSGTKPRQKTIPAVPADSKPSKKQKKPLASIPPVRSAAAASSFTRDSLKKAPFSSQKIATTSTTADPARNSRRKASGETESRTNRAISNAESTANRSTTVRKTTQPMDSDPFPMVAIRDIHRDKTPWQLSSASGDKGFVPSSPKALTSFSPMKRSPKAQGSTPLSWLLGGGSPYQADLPELRKTSTASALKKWTATRKVGAQTIGFSGKLDDSSKMDSLTTLKMSLRSGQSNQPPTHPSPAGTTQSRWVPTAIVTRASATSSSTTPLPPTTTSTSTTTITKSVQELSPEPTQVSVSTEASTSRSKTGELNDLNEARASDSISKFTTYWSDTNGNELLATTRRLFQQPLPQIAQTGEFFNAETISSWPERYQTMMEGARTSPVYESTRRNGESYETSAPRHKLETTPPVERSQTTLADLTTINLPGITVLPANHKLTTVPAQDSQTQPQQANVESTPGESTIPPEMRRTVPAPMVAYTMMGPFSEETVQPLEQTERATGEPDVSVSVTPKFPQVMDDLQLTIADGSNQKSPLDNVNASSAHLRPPYSELQESTDDIQALSQSPFNQTNQRKPHASRKLYDLLSTASNFMSPPPLNQQRFNLSALKFLAQSILQHGNHSLRDEAEGYQGLARQNKAASHQLLDLLNDSAIPPNYYELLLNETSAQTSADSHNRTSGKSLLGRAGNLLNDLRQLEQKKAAALMAAIRYQVPSPLVRPWDVVSDLQAFSGIAHAPVSERLDEDISQVDRLTQADLLRESLALAQASRAIKSALMKQRVVPRDELEARLRGSKTIDYDDPIMSDRRSDSTNSSSYMDDTLQYSVSTNSSRHDENDRVLPNGDPLKSSQNRGNDTKSWLEKLFSWSANKYDLLTNKTGDFDLIALSNTSAKEEVGAEAARYPMYIRLNDYQTASSAKPMNLKAKSERQSLPSSAVAARLRKTLNTRDPPQEEVDDGGVVKEDPAPKEQNVGKKASEFDCHDQLAGFYPDIDSSCQTFYHCSNTGHLLTFNCPQQTRFDEKSLKCGPWFEVPCDLGRMKLKRPL